MNGVTELIRPKALYEGVADSIRDRIFEHILPPGAVVDEVSLARHYGVSRTPVREAIKVLVHEGLLNMSVFHGCRVAEVSREDLSEILDVVEILDAHALSQIVQRPGKAKLVRLFDEYECNAKASPEQREGAWSSFCRQIRKELGNTPFAAVSRSLHQQLRLCLGAALDHADAGAPPKTRADLLQAMLDGDLKGVNRYCHIHAEVFRAAMLAAFDQLSQKRIARPEPV
jgi:DNA-binding GntR family transcriptional regulator